MSKTVAGVEKLKPTKVRREIRDGGCPGLYLIIQPSGAKSFAMRFRRPDGASAKLTLGPLDLSGAESKSDPEIGAPLTLASARRLAADIHHDRARGRDVIVDEAAKRRRLVREGAENAANTFGVLARKFIDEHRVKKWKTRPRGWRETARTLGLDYPPGSDPSKTEPKVIKGSLADTWGDKPIAAITGDDVYAVVEEATDRGIPGLKRRNAGKSNSRGRSLARSLSKLFAWGVKRRKVAINPCTGVDVPEAPAARSRTLTDAEIKSFWAAASRERPEFSAALKLLLLTGCRLKEVSGMRRNEMSEDGAAWNLPGNRTKNHLDFVAPLPPLVRELIAEVPAAGGEFVFSTNGGRTPVSLGSKIKNRLDAAMKIPPWRLHDLRRTFSTGAAKLRILPHVIEACLNHVSGFRSGVAGTYNKYDYLPEKTEAMERWAAHVAGVVSGKAANVTPIRRSAS